MINSIVNLILHLILAPPRIMLSVLNSTPKSRTGSDKIGAGILFLQSAIRSGYIRMGS